MNLVFFVEDRSTKTMLEGLLPRLLPSSVSFTAIAFEGKSDMEKQMPIKLRGWRNPNTRFVAVRDQDSGDCIVIKNRLRQICNAAGKPETLVRIACHELESWYLGDLTAVALAFQQPTLGTKQASEKFRNPDRLNNAKDELIRLTQSKYQEIAGSRAIAPHLRLDGANQSHSFGVFLNGVRGIAGLL